MLQLEFFEFNSTYAILLYLRWYVIMRLDIFCINVKQQFLTKRKIFASFKLKLIMSIVCFVWTENFDNPFLGNFFLQNVFKKVLHVPQKFVQPAEFPQLAYTNQSQYQHQRIQNIFKSKKIVNSSIASW